MCAAESMRQFGPEEPGRFYGKYRAMVIENVDPMDLARIKVSVPAVPGTTDTWALPCVPYAGDGDTPVGFYAIPPVGAHVWIEFEGGDPSYPIWTGCYWEAGEFVEPKNINGQEPPRVKMLKTMDSDFILDDTEQKGGVTLQVDTPAVDTKVLMKFDSEGVLIETGVCTVTMNPKEKKTEIKVSETRITLTEQAIEMKTGSVKIDADQGIEVKAGQAIKATSGTDLDLQAGTALKAKGSTTADLEAGTALTAKGATTTVKASAQLTLDGGGMATLKGGLVKIN